MASRSKKKQVQRNIVAPQKQTIKKTSNGPNWFIKNWKNIVLYSTIAIFSVIVIVGVANAGSNGVYGRIVPGNPTIVYIGSTDCEPCKQLQPVMHSLGQKYDGQINIKFYDSWNTTEGARMASQYNITSIPTLLFMRTEPQVNARMMGYNPQSEIETQMRQLGWVS